MTLNQGALKYLIPPARVGGFIHALGARLRFHHFTGDFLELECREHVRPSRRRVQLDFGDELEQLRVTLEVELAFYAPVLALWTRGATLSRSDLGQPRPGAPACLVEIELRAGTQEWLSRALDIARAIPERFSTFVVPAEATRRRD